MGTFKKPKKVKKVQDKDKFENDVYAEFKDAMIELVQKKGGWGLMDYEYKDARDLWNARLMCITYCDDNKCGKEKMTISGTKKGLLAQLPGFKEFNATCEADLEAHEEISAKCMSTN